MKEKIDLKKEKQSFLLGAAIISAGGFIAKILGAIYRIPLTKYIGAYGVGLYQMAYPLYCLLLTISSAGIPSALSCMIARAKNRSEQITVFKSSLMLFACIGGLGTAIMFLCAPLFSKLQGESLSLSYQALAPAVFLVAIVSVLRGWFQGNCDMMPTAASEVIEQLIKVFFGILFIYLFRENVYFAVCGALGAVSLSEIGALLYLFLRYKTEIGKKPLWKTSFRSYGSILKLTIPVTLSSAILPLSQFADSALIVWLLKRFRTDAVSIYGLYSGGALALINLPVSICYGLAAAIIPRLSKGNNPREKVFFAAAVTLILSLPFAVILFFFAQPIGEFVFRSMSSQESQLLAQMVKIMAISSVTLSLAQTFSACLTGQGKPSVAAWNMAIGVVIKTIFLVVFLLSEKLCLYAGPLAANICYLLVFVLDLIGNLRYAKGAKDDNDCGIGRGKRRLDAKGKGSDFNGRKSNFADGAIRERKKCNRVKNSL